MAPRVKGLLARLAAERGVLGSTFIAAFAHAESAK
jgi:hypothetical protein